MKFHKKNYMAVAIEIEELNLTFIAAYCETNTNKKFINREITKVMQYCYGSLHIILGVDINCRLDTANHADFLCDFLMNN